MKILIIEDERKLARFIRQGLEQHGHVADVVFSGTEGLNRLAVNQYDLLLLDLMIPGQTGFEVLKNLREFHLMVPVIILSALTDPQKVVQGLDLGAIDYLRKPFDFDELLARIRAAQRRNATEQTTRLQAADLYINLLDRQVTKADTVIELTNREFALLELLLRRAGRVVTKQEITEKVWDADYDQGSNVVEVHIYQLRKKLDGVGEKNLIETLIGRGYRLRTNAGL